MQTLTNSQERQAWWAMDKFGDGHIHGVHFCKTGHGHESLEKKQCHDNWRQVSCLLCLTLLLLLLLLCFTTQKTRSK